MNILICNDDGYLAQGIAVLARVAAEFSNVRALAPQRYRSGVRKLLSLDRPLLLRQVGNGVFFVICTSTSCFLLSVEAPP